MIPLKIPHIISITFYTKILNIKICLNCLFFNINNKFLCLLRIIIFSLIINFLKLILYTNRNGLFKQLKESYGERMKAVVFKGPQEVAVEEVENPTIEKPTDVIVKISSSAICGTDLHRYDGETPAEPGSILGHEPMGVVDVVGTGVQLIKPGDRVVITPNIACGFCLNCIQGLTNKCLTVNPHASGGTYGSSKDYAGAQQNI